MFGNLRLCEIHPTLLSYQVLSMQIQSIPHQLEKRNPNFKRFLSYELPFKFALIFHALTQQKLCSSLPILLYFHLRFKKALVNNCSKRKERMTPEFQTIWYLMRSSSGIGNLRCICFQIVSKIRNSMAALAFWTCYRPC